MDERSSRRQTLGEHGNSLALWNVRQRFWSEIRQHLNRTGTPIAETWKPWMARIPEGSRSRRWIHRIRSERATPQKGYFGFGAGLISPHNRNPFGISRHVPAWWPCCSCSDGCIGYRNRKTRLLPFHFLSSVPTNDLAAVRKAMIFVKIVIKCGSPHSDL